jgi:hypothetical protein
MIKEKVGNNMFKCAEKFGFFCAKRIVMFVCAFFMFANVITLNPGFAVSIGLSWDGGSIPTPASCTYGSTFTSPSAPTAPTGYHFVEWQILDARPSQGGDCGIDDLDYTEDGSWLGQKSIDHAHCYWVNPTIPYNGTSCSDSGISDLTWGEWKVEFSYGTIYGVAKCSSTEGDNIEETWDTKSSRGWLLEGEPEIDKENDNEYCWCRLTGFLESKANEICEVTSAGWVFGIYLEGKCEDGCASWCANYTFYNMDFRNALYNYSLQ